MATVCRLVEDIISFDKIFVMSRFSALSTRESSRVGLIFESPALHGVLGEFRPGWQISVNLLNMYIDMFRVFDRALSRGWQNATKVMIPVVTRDLVLEASIYQLIVFNVDKKCDFILGPFVDYQYASSHMNVEYATLYQVALNVLLRLNGEIIVDISLKHYGNGNCVKYEALNGHKVDSGIFVIAAADFFQQLSISMGKHKCFIFTPTILPPRFNRQATSIV